MLSNIVPPSIVGDASTTGNTLTATNGGWIGDAGTYTYQWMSDTNPIPGATANTYVLAAQDATHLLTVAVVANDGAGRQLTAISPEILAGSLPTDAPIADEPSADTEI